MPDPNDYPTDDELARIRDWPMDDPLGWFAFIKTCWWAADWGWSEDWMPEDRSGDVPPQCTYRISTGGWSGNEEIISAMRQNAILWSLTWQESKRGGHFEFAVTKR